jgi:predicted PurR-regulated permease PerM
MSEQEVEKERPVEEEKSPPWGRNVKLLVTVITLILLVTIALRFTDLLLQVVAAGIIAYVLTPIINLITERTPLKRTSSIILTYLATALLLIAAIVTLGVGTFNQVGTLINSVPNLLQNAVGWLSATNTISLGPLEVDVAFLRGSIDWESFGDQLISAILPIVNQGGRTVVIILSSTVQVLTVILFTFIVSIYLAFEMGRMGGYISRAVYQPGYRRDTERILREFGRIWQAYLRGQIVLGFVIFLAVWISLSILGVQNAFALGIVSGILEFLPVVGPFVGTAVAAIFAFFQPTNYLGLEPVTYALLIIGVMIVIQQIENNILVPRIVGGALGLHPLVVIIGVFMGASLVGLIGAILAAPVLATSKLLGTYAWRKMFDLPPFPSPEKVQTAEKFSIAQRAVRLGRRFKKPTGESE